MQKKSLKPLSPEALLSISHYHTTCPDAESIISQKVDAWPVSVSVSVSISVCVKGCDESILLNHKGSERSAFESRTLRGFQLIDEIKNELERRCPRKVSYTHALSLPKRVPFWEVLFVCKDGNISLAKEANLVPYGLWP
ncbi:hypothetical protein VNO77_27483 [Canavalia gladiata]|uniref:peroxidase n=1 Tax=Canavalia gladiata TaxID=3824 RepID=A0AAN9KXY0_CANGL